MAQTIKLKRSNQSDSSGVPTTSQLELGEVAINTYHGKMYIKKSDEADPNPTEAIVEVGTVADGSITNAKLGNQAVTGDKIFANTIASGNMANNSIFTAAIADGQVTTSKLANGAVTNTKIASGAVSNSNLAGSISADKLADTYITEVSDDTTPQLSGNLDCNNKHVRNIDKLSVGTNTSLSTADFYVSGYKTAEENELVRIVNNNSSSGADGRIITFYTSTNFQGSVGTAYVPYGQGVYFSSNGCGLRATTQYTTDIVSPCNSIGEDKHDDVDLGSSSNSFDDVYATGGVTTSSDRTLKQDIETLSEAERRVAVACKGLLRKYRLISRVEEKGDDARIHFGIIAQDLEDAFTAEGLDAGRYGMFTCTDWWEGEETRTLEDGTEDTYTGKFYDEETAPEDSVKHTIRGVRYSELLAFIIAAL
jgi:hypothetical protein